MSTTVTFTISERPGFLALTGGAPETKFTVTRPTKVQALAEALSMVFAAHRGEMEQAWAEAMKAVAPLLKATNGADSEAES